jgi:hypothetical protein
MHHGRLLDHAHLKAVILAIFALHRQFGQVVLVQKFRQGLDEGHVRVGGMLAHAVLVWLPWAFWPCLAGPAPLCGAYT